MQEVRLWELNRVDGRVSVTRVDALRSTETEAMLEDVLVASPDLLEPGLHLIGRQVPTTNGPLDLLGIDQNGRLVVFELKRGTLARDVVAQILDYASDLNEMDRDRLAAHLAARSGHGGVEKIGDFFDWYERIFPDHTDEFSLMPRMVLVGLGVDARALRMVKFLAEAGLEIDVLTFHAFERDAKTFLARQVEVSGQEEVRRGRTRRSGSGRTREALEGHLAEAIVEAGVDDLVEEMRSFIAEHLGTKRGAPNKGGVTFYRSVLTEDGARRGRAYVGIVLIPERSNGVQLVLTERCWQDGGARVEEFMANIGARKNTHSTQGYEQYEVWVDASKWAMIQGDLAEILIAIREGAEAAAET